MSGFQHFFLGFLFIFNGIKLLFKKPELLKLVIIPFVINSLILIFALRWGQQNLEFFINQSTSFMFGDSSGWIYTLFYYPIKIIFWLSFVSSTIYFTFLISTFVASPFNCMLAEQTLMHLGVIEARPFKIFEWIKASVRMLGVGLLRSLFFSGIGFFLFIASFIPIVNIVTSFIVFFIIAIDCMDYSMESRYMSLKDRMNYVANHLNYFLGMATALSLTMFIPGLTLLLLPPSVAGAAWIMSQTKG